MANSRSFGLSVALPPGFVGERTQEGWVAALASEREALFAAGLFDPARSGAAGERSSLGGRGVLRRVRLPSGPALVRQYLHGGLLRFLTGERFADPSRPFRELSLAAELRGVGVPTPEPLAAAALGHWPAFRLFFVSREVPGQDFAAALREENDPGRRRGILSRAGLAICRFHDRGFLHRDLHPKNLLVEASTGEVFLLDLDGSRRVPSLSRNRRLANLTRLFRYGARRQALHGEEPWKEGESLALLDGYEPGGAQVLWAEVRGRLGREAFLHRIGWRFEKLFGGGGG